MSLFGGELRATLLMLVAVSWLSGCQFAFGDYEKTGVASAANGGTTNPGGFGGSGPTSSCTTNGQYRCNLTSLEVCDAGQWRPSASCASAEQCDATRGVCLDCLAGTNRCTSWRLETCSDSGDSWTTRAECDTADYCDVTSGGCLPCLADEAFCSGATLYVCKADQSDWDVTNCSDINLCNARSRDCRPCTEGEYQCNEKSLQRCDNNQDWQELDSCATAELCQKSLDVHAAAPASFTNRCEAPGCTPNAYQCNPDNKAQLLGCPPSLLGWSVVDDCLTAALCDAVSGHCDVAACQPGTYQCNGDRLELCRQDGTAATLVKTCASAAYCNATKRDCVPCLEGEFQCSGTNLQKCNANQTWATQKVCGSAALCDVANKTCIDPTCPKAAALRCSGKELQVCVSDLTAWQLQDTCAVAALCDVTNGRCNSPICEAGATRCTGNVYEVCDATTLSWKVSKTCTASQLCSTTNAASPCLDGCPTPGRQCNSNTLEGCVVDTVNNKATWQFLATCSTAALCSVDSDTCIQATCEADAYDCSGSALRQCNAGRTGFDTVKTCTALQICDATGKQCDACAHDAFTCSGAVLKQCNSDGQDYVLTTDCGSGLCYASGATGYCHLCNSGETQCSSGTGLTACVATSSGQRAWGTAIPCDTKACQDNTGNADYCAVCPTAGEVTCVPSAVTGSTQTCKADRSGWSAATACSPDYGCVDDGTTDYCATACSPNAVACVNETSTHTCAANGSGWSATLSACADTSSLMACSGGVLSGSVACPTVTPYCVGDQCVACTGTTKDCEDSDTARTCDSGNWVKTECKAPTPVCSSGECVGCATSTDCTDPTPVCSSGECVGCATSTDCTNPLTPYCTANQCVACSGAAGCADGETCNASGQCIASAVGTGG